jgi:hypothetical protein
MVDINHTGILPIRLPVIKKKVTKAHQDNDCLQQLIN